MSDFSFLEDPNFGLSETFSVLPGPLPLNPKFELTQKSNVEEHNDVIEDSGLHFKLAPISQPDAFYKSIKSKNMAPKLYDFSKGTTTLGFVFQGGVLIAVDARATMGSYIGSNNVRKVLEINNYLLGTMAGGAADCQYWERDLARVCRIYELQHDESVTVAAASKILANTVAQYKGYGLSMGTMVAGSDRKEKNGAALYYVDDSGSRLKGQLFAVGSGSTYAYGVLDNHYNYNLTLEEAVQLGIRAIASATYRDSASGGVVRVYHVHKDGWTKIQEGLDVSELHYAHAKSRGFREDARDLPLGLL